MDALDSGLELRHRGVIAEAITAVTGADQRLELLSSSIRLDELGVSSLLLYAFISKLELLLGVDFRDQDIDPSNFDSLGALDRMVGRYTGDRSV